MRYIGERDLSKSESAEMMSARTYAAPQCSRREDTELSPHTIGQLQEQPMYASTDEQAVRLGVGPLGRRVTPGVALGCEHHSLGVGGLGRRVTPGVALRREHR